MINYARKNQECAFKGSYTTEYGFRCDTEKYAYLLRCNPTKGDYNFYCYCYKKDFLDKHMKDAKEGIRFITSDYRTLFLLPDGEKIHIRNKDGSESERVCRYIDAAHTEIGNNIFHNREFAERMEGNGAFYFPAEEPLPAECFSVLPSTGEVIYIARYERGYFPANNHPGLTSRQQADAANKMLGVTKAQEAAMLAGSMFSWDCPAAHPKNYDANGKLKKPPETER